MKTKSNYLIAIMLMLFTICEAKVNFEAEKKAINETLKAEKLGFTSRNMDLMKENSVTDSGYIQIYSNNKEYIINSSWNEQEIKIKEWWSSDPSPKVKTQIDFDYVRLKIYPKSAYVVLKVYYKEIIDGKTIIKGEGYETIFLEKINGKWKNACQTILSTKSYEDEPGN